LVENYKDSDTVVAIFEYDEPHYVIGVSTGTQASSQYLSSDPTKLCPTTVQYGSKECVSDRLQIRHIRGSENDNVILEAFFEQEAADYPPGLLFVKMSETVGSNIWVSQSTVFQPDPNANLQWRIITASPASEGTQDTIVAGDPLFGPMILLGSVGFCVCTFFWTYFYRKRTVRVIAFADWKFTCVFVVGCSLLNTSTFTLLGNNTKATCLMRMWFFHFFFVVALSPLFVKVWRMYRLTQAAFKRATITNAKAAMYTLPLIVLQVVILTIFSVVDPPRPTEIIELDGSATRRIVCEANTDAFFIVEIVFEAGLVVAGCVLAYLQRNMDDKFGETKQMLVAMYNIALVGIVLLIVINVADIDGAGAKMLQAIGILWGSVLSAAAFVVPRMVQIHQGIGIRRSNVSVSGISGVSVDPTSGAFRSSNNYNSNYNSGTFSENGDYGYATSQRLSTLNAISEDTTAVASPEEAPSSPLQAKLSLGSSLTPPITNTSEADEAEDQVVTEP
jgi:7 transmembrane sweet-taste receptor of 3 GCPR